VESLPSQLLSSPSANSSLRVPQTRAVQARYDKLSRAIAERRVDCTLLVTQKDLLTFEQKRSAPTNVQPVVVDDLSNRLAALASGT